VAYKEADLTLNKYVNDNPEKSVFDERTIEKWSHVGRNAQPYIGIEGSDDEFDEDCNFVLTEEQSSNNHFINNLFK